MSILGNFKNTIAGIKDQFNENLAQLPESEQAQVRAGLDVLKKSETAQVIKRTAAVIPKLQPKRQVEEFKQSVDTGLKLRELPTFEEGVQKTADFIRGNKVNRFIADVGAGINRFGFQGAEASANLVKILNNNGISTLPGLGMPALTTRDTKIQEAINTYSNDVIDLARKKQIEISSEVNTPLVASFSQAGSNLLLAGGLYSMGLINTAPAILTALETLPTYSEAIDAGRTPDQALAITAASAAGTFLLEKVGLDLIFKNMGSKFVSNRLANVMTKMFIGGTVETVQENLQNAWQALVDKTTFEGFEGETAREKVAEIFEGWLETSIISFTLGSLMAGVGSDVHFQQTRNVRTRVDETITSISEELGVSREEAQEVFDALAEYVKGTYETVKTAFEDTRGTSPLLFPSGFFQDRFTQQEQQVFQQIQESVQEVGPQQTIQQQQELIQQAGEILEIENPLDIIDTIQQIREDTTIAQEEPSGVAQAKEVAELRNQISDLQQVISDQIADQNVSLAQLQENVNDILETLNLPEQELTRIRKLVTKQRTKPKLGKRVPGALSGALGKAEALVARQLRTDLSERARSLRPIRSDLRKVDRQFLVFFDRSIQAVRRGTRAAPIAELEARIGDLELLESSAREQIRRAEVDRRTGIRRAEQEPPLKEVDTTEEQKAERDFDQDFYDGNRDDRNFKKIFRDDASNISENLQAGVKLAFQPISTRAGKISQKLKNRLRGFEFDLRKKQAARLKLLDRFLQKSSKMPKADKQDFDLAQKNGDTATQRKLARKYGFTRELDGARKVLDEIYADMKTVGYDVGYLEGYFPRVIKDVDGFIRHFQGQENWNVIQDTIRAKEAEAGRLFQPEEKAHLINTLLRGYANDGITLSKTGAMKTRSVEFVDKEINRFYMNSNAALVRYIERTTEAIETRRFFGKTAKGDPGAIEDSIGFFVNKLMEEQEIDVKQEKELRDILNARFNPRGIKSSAISLYRNISYIDTMGGVTPAITQIGDLAFSMYKAGTWTALKTIPKSAIGRGLQKEDVFIENIAAEYSEPTKAAAALDFTFKITGLDKMDAIGKATLLESVYQRRRREAQRDPEKLKAEISRVFDGTSFEDTADGVIADLIAGRQSDNVKYMLFYELLEVQPVALSELPEGYLRGGNWRILYMLKTFQIKLLDVFRNEAFAKMADPDPQVKIQGFTNLLRLAALLVMANATADTVKDFLLGRDTDLKDMAVDNILRLFGISKFYTWEARRAGIRTATIKLIAPPFKLGDALVRDIGKSKIPFLHPESESVRSIPLVGNFYYWWFGKGSAKGGSPGSLNINL